MDIELSTITPYESHSLMAVRALIGAAEVLPAVGRIWDTAAVVVVLGAVIGAYLVRIVHGSGWCECCRVSAALAVVVGVG